VRPRWFFFYGTLGPESGTAMARWLGSRIAAASPATAPGRLLAIRDRGGWYPALVRGRAGERTHGTLARVVLAPGVLARIDRYEGREYRRAALLVRAGGARQVATIYLWRGPARGLPVRGGDFPAWLNRSRRRAFGAEPAVRSSSCGIDRAWSACHRAAP